MKQTAVQWLVEQILPNRIDLKTNNVKQTAVDFLIEKLIPQTITQEQFYIIEQAVEMEKQQKGYSEEEVIDALRSVELKYNKDFTRIYEGVSEYLKELKNK